MFLKRFKLTKKGKILHRPSGLGHGFVKNKISKKRKSGLKDAPEEVLIYSEYHQ
jgi:ribosomal protein L35